MKLSNNSSLQANTIDAVLKLCDTFQGVIEVNDYKNYVLTLLFYKYISDLQNDTNHNHDSTESVSVDNIITSASITVPYKANFWALYEQRDDPGNGRRIDEALHAIENENAEILKDAFIEISFNSNIFGDENQKNDILCKLLTGFASDELNFTASGMKECAIGGVYDALLEHFASVAGRKIKEFYTPPEVSDVVSEIVRPADGEDICDPVASSGSLLVACGQKIQAKYANANSYRLYGQEESGVTCALAKINMLLHDEFRHEIKLGNVIRYPKLLNSDQTLKLFDVVVGVIPFSVDKWDHEYAKIDPYNRFSRGVPPSTRGEYAYILHMIESMKSNTGRMAVIAPHGVLFRGSIEGVIRKKIIEENLLDAVIGLPEKLFYGSSIKTTIIVLSRVKSDNNVLFIDASHDFKEGKRLNTLRDKDVRKIVGTYSERKNIDKYSHLANFDEIVSNDCNLNIPRYIGVESESIDVDIDSLNKQRDLLIKEISSLNTKIKSAIETII